MWSKSPVKWIEGNTLFVSAVFTYHLPGLRSEFTQKSFLWDRVVIGGPAVKLMPNFFDDLDFVTVGGDLPGMLQKHNPEATRTSLGCPKKCRFCAVPRIEPYFTELKVWNPSKVICDNNFLACSKEHFYSVMEVLKNLENVDFSQGLDHQYLTSYHAEELSKLKKPIIRLSLDSESDIFSWKEAFHKLRFWNVPKSSIRTYALIGWNTGPQEAWDRCTWIDSHNVLVCPQWFHPLSALEHNKVYDFQKDLGWNDKERKRIMGYFYKCRGKVPDFVKV